MKMDAPPQSVSFSPSPPSPPSPLRPRPSPARRPSGDGSAGGEADPVLRGALLHSATPVRTKWRAVALNLGTGWVEIYDAASSSAAAGPGRSRGRVRDYLPGRIPGGTRPSLGGSSVGGGSIRGSVRGSFSADERGCRLRSEVVPLAVGQGSEDDSLRSVFPLHPEHVLRLALPWGMWEMTNDKKGSDDAFVLHYDLGSTPSFRSVDVDDGDLSMRSQSQSSLAVAGEFGKGRARGRLTLRCPGGGNEKSMWRKAAAWAAGGSGRQGTIARGSLSASSFFSPVDDEDDMEDDEEGGLSAKLDSALSRYRRVVSNPKQSELINRIARIAARKRVAEADVNWRYRKDFAAAKAARKMSSCVAGISAAALNKSLADISDDYDEEEDYDDFSGSASAPPSPKAKVKEYKVVPYYAYPDEWMTPAELTREMVRDSEVFHDMRRGSAAVGSLRVEVISVQGIPRPKALAERLTNDIHHKSSGGAVAYLASSSEAFRTDVIPGIRDHFWLSKARRAAVFPVPGPYARLYAGVFDAVTNDFAGRVVVDVAALRPGCTYDITLPLRRTAYMYTREARGCIRLRIKLDWDDERAAVLSYLRRGGPKVRPHGGESSAAIACGDRVALRNVTNTVHGSDQHGKFSRAIMRASGRELKLYKLHTQHIMKSLVADISGWRRPIYSTYVFGSWMHCVYENDISLGLPYFFGFVFLLLARNYATYVLGSDLHMGYAPVTCREILRSLLLGGTRKGDPGGRYRMRPLEVPTLSSADGQPTPRPQSSLVANLFSLLGLADGLGPQGSWSGSGNHLEFPFSDVRRQPKMSGMASGDDGVLDGSSDDEDDDDEDDDIFVRAPKALERKEDSHRESEVAEIGPEQDVRIPTAGKTVFEILAMYRGYAHMATLGLVKDRVLRARRLGRKAKAGEAGREVVDGAKNKGGGGGDDEDLVRAMEKALGIGRKKNPLLAMREKFCLPVVRIQRVGLTAFRMCFNLMTWRDPFLTFWFSMALLCLIVVASLMPWRAVFLVGGIAGVGPQNWLLRLRRERRRRQGRGGGAAPQPHLQPRLHLHRHHHHHPHRHSQSRSHPLAPSGTEERLPPMISPFLGHVNAARGEKGTVLDAIWVASDGEEALAEVSVPEGAFRQERFYDWPPDPFLSGCRAQAATGVEPVRCYPDG